MKRYSYDGDCLEQDKDGGWVRFEDVEVLLAELNLLRSEKASLPETPTPPQRYDMHLYEGESPPISPYPCRDGIWVKWEDIEPIFQPAMNNDEAQRVVPATGKEGSMPPSPADASSPQDGGAK